MPPVCKGLRQACTACGHGSRSGGSSNGAQAINGAQGACFDVSTAHRSAPADRDGWICGHAAVRRGRGLMAGGQPATPLGATAGAEQPPPGTTSGVQRRLAELQAAPVDPVGEPLPGPVRPLVLPSTAVRASHSATRPGRLGGRCPVGSGRRAETAPGWGPPGPRPRRRRRRAPRPAAPGTPRAPRRCSPAAARRPTSPGTPRERQAVRGRPGNALER